MDRIVVGIGQQPEQVLVRSDGRGARDADHAEWRRDAEISPCDLDIVRGINGGDEPLGSTGAEAATRESREIALAAVGAIPVIAPVDEIEMHRRAGVGKPLWGKVSSSTPTKQFAYAPQHYGASVTAHSSPPFTTK